MKFKNPITPFNVNDPREVGIKYLIFRNLMPLKYLERLRLLLLGSGAYFTPAFDSTKSIFIHIPKAAGTSVSKAFYGGRQGHHTAIALKCANESKFSSFYKFSIVRNPYSRLYSTYNYLLKSPHLEDSQWAKDNIAHFENFNEFVCSWVTTENIHSWKHFLPQVYFLCDSEGTILVDDVGKLENIDAIFSTVSAKLGFEGVLPEENVMGKVEKGYRNFYLPEAIKVVKDVYAEDLKMFDYEF